MRTRILYLFLVFGILLPAVSDVQGRAAAYTTAEQKDATVYYQLYGNILYEKSHLFSQMAPSIYTSIRYKLC